MIFEDKTGLKLPKSAVAEKEFFVIPEEYLTQGGAGTETGVFIEKKNKKGETLYEFQPVEIFSKDKEKGLFYIKMDEFEKGDVILLPASGEDSDESSRKKLTLDQTIALPGVYNVNKGYAEFKDLFYSC